jgi:hypothetical protein
MMAFMTDRVDAELLKAAPQVRVLACALKGADYIDISACEARGIAVSIVPDLLTSPLPNSPLALRLAWRDIFALGTPQCVWIFAAGDRISIGSAWMGQR